MAKQVKLTDEVYDNLKELADKELRSMSAQVQYLINYLEATPVAKAKADMKMTFSDEITPIRTFGETKPFPEPDMKKIEKVYHQEVARIERGRTMSDVKADIDQWAADMKDDLDPNIVQDAETLAKNKKEYNDTKQALWAEYHELKASNG